MDQEFPGGHREKGETIDDTAKRELYEESGAIEFYDNLSNVNWTYPDIQPQLLSKVYAS